MGFFLIQFKTLDDSAERQAIWNVDYKISWLAKDKTLDESRIKLLFSHPFPATCLFLIASSTQFSNTFRWCFQKTLHVE